MVLLIVFQASIRPFERAIATKMFAMDQGLGTVRLASVAAKVTFPVFAAERSFAVVAENYCGRRSH